MSVRRVGPTEAKSLIDEHGYVLIDVRSVPEFEAGHPEGAFNVPLNHAGPSGMVPNPDFLSVVAARFPKDQKLVIACKAGGRSLKAASMLVAAGYVDIVDQRAGWSGASDPFGQGLEPGWQAAGLPTALEPASGRSYAELELLARTR